MNEDSKAYITDLINNNPALTKIRAGINTIKNEQNPILIEPIITQDPNSMILDAGKVQIDVPQRTIMEKIANGITDFSTGFNENKNNAFMPSNLTNNKFSNGEDKNFMGRLGEAFGTGARTMNRPGVKGLATGLITTALTGNPMFGFTTGLNTANASADSDVYAQALRNEGFDVPVGLFNTYSSSDLTAMTNSEIKKRQAESLINYRQDRNNIEKDYKENKIRNEQKALEIQENKNNAKKDVTQQDGWNEALAGYSQRINDPRYSDKLDQLKAKFIARYGVDPDKYLKD